MNRRTAIWGFFIFASMALGLWWGAPATGGHFDNMVSDHSHQDSIHPVVVNSGFQLRQNIDTRNFHISRPSKPQDQLCMALRIEYDRAWTTLGTVLVKLSTDHDQWKTTIKSSEITTYFQTFCLPGAKPEAIADKAAWVDISVVEPSLSQVALFALGPATPKNETAILNGKTSEFSLPYKLIVRQKPHDRDLIKYIAVFLFGGLILIAALYPVLSGRPRPAARPSAEHRPPETHP